MSSETSELKDILKEFSHEIRESNEQMGKMITINLTLQSKITELLIKMADLVKNVNEMVILLKETGEEEEQGSDFSPMVKALEDMKGQNEEILVALQAIDKHMSRDYTREMLGRAIRKE